MGSVFGSGSGSGSTSPKALHFGLFSSGFFGSGAGSGIVSVITFSCTTFSNFFKPILLVGSCKSMIPGVLVGSGLKY